PARLPRPRRPPPRPRDLRGLEPAARARQELNTPAPEDLSCPHSSASTAGSGRGIPPRMGNLAVGVRQFTISHLWISMGCAYASRVERSADQLIGFSVSPLPRTVAIGRPSLPTIARSVRPPALSIENATVAPSGESTGNAV